MVQHDKATDKTIQQDGNVKITKYIEVYAINICGHLNNHFL